MIHIHKELWVVKGNIAEESEHALSYMTHVELNKQGNDAAAFIKRKSTGTAWAERSTRRSESTPEVITFSNTPTSKFRIVGSATRWSTENKLIRVEDSRGFVVEVPVSNLTTLLNYVTVVKGVIQDNCVWGREGSNHILLPVNSDVYTKAMEQTAMSDTRVKFNKLEVGQVIKFCVDAQEEYVFCGKGKAKWRVITKKSKGLSPWCGYIHLDNDPVISIKEFYDDKFNFIFKKIDGYKYSPEIVYRTSGVCVVLSKKAATKLPPELDLHVPDRLCDKTHTYESEFYSTSATLHIKMKEDKITKELT